jgi:hypothetical protein
MPGPAGVEVIDFLGLEPAARLVVLVSTPHDVGIEA